MLIMKLVRLIAYNAASACFVFCLLVLATLVSVLATLVSALATLVSSLATFLMWKYRKFPKYSDTQKICCNHSKI